MKHWRPLIIAHRGASGVAPESTASAIREAVRARADMVELDVQMTSDRRLIVFHDDRLNRTTNGSGVVRRTRASAIARLDAGTWFHPRFAGQRVLSVAHALRLIPERMQVNFELKRTPQRRALIGRLLRLLRRTGHAQRLVLSSFDSRFLRLLRATPLRRALICRRHPDASLRLAIRLGCEAWHPMEALVTPARVRRAHDAGLRVHAWTVDDPRRLRRLLRAGVDGVFTNHPARLRRALS